MIITSPGYMQTRSLEAGMALVMLLSGIIFALPGQTLGSPVYAELRAWMPSWLTEESGGGILAVTACLRWFALWRNGRLSSTPLVRMAGCAVGAAFWFTAASGISVAEMAAAPWLLALTGSMFILEIYSAFRTGIDAEALDSLGLRRRAFARREAGRKARWEAEAGA